MSKTRRGISFRISTREDEKLLQEQQEIEWENILVKSLKVNDRLEIKHSSPLLIYNLLITENPVSFFCKNSNTVEQYEVKCKFIDHPLLSIEIGDELKKMHPTSLSLQVYDTLAVQSSKNDVKVKIKMNSLYDFDRCHGVHYGGVRDLHYYSVSTGTSHLRIINHTELQESINQVLIKNTNLISPLVQLILSFLLPCRIITRKRIKPI